MCIFLDPVEFAERAEDLILIYSFDTLVKQMDKKIFEKLEKSYLFSRNKELFMTIYLIMHRQKHAEDFFVI